MVRLLWTNLDFVVGRPVMFYARLRDATFIQNIIGVLLKNALDQKLYRVG